MSLLSFVVFPSERLSLIHICWSQITFLLIRASLLVAVQVSRCTPESSNRSETNQTPKPAPKGAMPDIGTLLVGHVLLWPCDLLDNYTVNTGPKWRQPFYESWIFTMISYSFPLRTMRSFLVDSEGAWKTLSVWDCWPYFHHCCRLKPHCWPQNRNVRAS